jgi:hypothetical protein
MIGHRRTDVMNTDIQCYTVLLAPTPDDEVSTSNLAFSTLSGAFANSQGTRIGRLIASTADYEV